MIAISIFITAFCCFVCFRVIKKLACYNKGTTKGAIRLCTRVSKLLKLDPASVSKSVFAGILLLCLEILLGCAGLVFLIVSFNGYENALRTIQIVQITSMAVYSLYYNVVTQDN